MEEEEDRSTSTAGGSAAGANVGGGWGGRNVGAGVNAVASADYAVTKKVRK